MDSRLGLVRRPRQNDPVRDHCPDGVEKDRALAGHASLLSEIGRPTAARIISFVQPAQQQYFRGASTEIANLSPLLSCPCAEHDGQRVTQFRPACRLTSTYSRIRNSPGLDWKYLGHSVRRAC